MDTFWVKGSAPYPVSIGHSILADKNLFSELRSKQILLVCQSNTKRYAQQLHQSLKSTGTRIVFFELNGGEELKSIHGWTSIIDELLKHQFDRSCHLIAVGGGMLCDLVGFAAATYLRGVALTLVPTTLLAQVDAAVGGKVAINHKEGKNLIGNFFLPSAVIIDTATLETLPEREYLSGFAEVLKYGLILDKSFVHWLKDNLAAFLNKEKDCLLTIVRKCVQFKASVVEQDETELGYRAVLNFGHTLGHALEIEMEYQWTHGECVAVGMVAAMKIGLSLGELAENEVDALDNLIHDVGLPNRIPEHLEAKQLLRAQQRDKKSFQGKTQWVLLNAIGEAQAAREVPESVVEALYKGLGAR